MTEQTKALIALTRKPSRVGTLFVPTRFDSEPVWAAMVVHSSGLEAPDKHEPRLNETNGAQGAPYKKSGKMF